MMPEPNLEWHRLNTIYRLSQGTGLFWHTPEFADDLDVLSVAVKFDPTAYKYASDRLRGRFSVAALAMSYHPAARLDAPAHFRCCPAVVAAAGIADCNARRGALLGLPASQSVKNQIEACRILGGSPAVTPHVAGTLNRPLCAVAISGDTWELTPAQWTGAAGHQGLVDCFALVVDGPFEVVMEGPDGSFVRATAPLLMAWFPEQVMIIYS
jgi:hypothetical protein